MLTRKFLPFICLLLAASSCLAQFSSYEYDASGNRIRRTATPDLRPAIIMTDRIFAQLNTSKAMSLRIYNDAPVNTSTMVSARFFKPFSSFTLTLQSTSDLEWTLVDRGSFYEITTKSGVVIGGNSFKSILLNAQVTSIVVNNTYYLSVFIPDGSGGDRNVLNNSNQIIITTQF